MPAGGDGANRSATPWPLVVLTILACRARQGRASPLPEADAVFGSVCSFEAWPSVPIRVVVGADDRFFPSSFNGPWPGIGSVSRRTCCPAAT